jgi:hypothetical protein
MRRRMIGGSSCHEINWEWKVPRKKPMQGTVLEDQKGTVLGQKLRVTDYQFNTAVVDDVMSLFY